MREILYRGKRKDTGELIVSDSICQGNGAIKLWDKERRLLVDIEPETFCQYTGLTDKNGVKIFEGDIVSISKKDERGVVRWEDGDAVYVSGCDDNVYLLSFLVTLWKRDIEVIGNIHDNPELMEVVK